MSSWDEFYIGMCLHVSTKSKDRSTKLGAVIVGANHEVLSIGFNGFPRGVPDERESYHERPTKYLVTEHAERNAIFNCARQGIALEGTTMYLPFEPTPCARCTRAVIQSGIKHIIGTDVKFTGKGKQWDEDLALALEMLADAGIERTVVSVAGTDLDIRGFNEGRST
jgi:dCMP deaminase